MLFPANRIRQHLQRFHATRRAFHRPMLRSLWTRYLISTDRLQCWRPLWPLLGHGWARGLLSPSIKVVVITILSEQRLLVRIALTCGALTAKSVLRVFSLKSVAHHLHYQLKGAQGVVY